jgi:hypothetical protein
MAGFSSGKVIEKKIRVGLAPSTRAAFTTSAGIATSPASRTSATKGVVFHTSTRMAAWSAGRGEPSQSMPGKSRWSRP